jgi:hypothetical protein
MENRIEIKSASRAAADGALHAFRAEAHDLFPYLDRLTIHLDGEPGDAPDAEERSVRVRMDFRAGGRFLSESQGRDWDELIPQAAARAARGARVMLANRWELQDSAAGAARGPGGTGSGAFRGGGWIRAPTAAFFTFPGIP